MSHIGSISEQMTSVTDLLGPMAFLVGLGLAAMGALKFKAYTENPQDASISSAVGLMLVSTLMIGLSAFLSATGEGFVDPAPMAQVEEAAPTVVSGVPQEPLVIPDSQVDGVETGQQADPRWVTERAIK